MKIQSVFIVPPLWGAPHTFKKAGYDLAKHPNEADAIVLMGGEDINPKLYEQHAHPRSYFNDARDENELRFIRQYRDKKPFIGICRGAQLLNVMAGGSMWQHVLGHSGTHEVFIEPYKQIKRQTVITNSVHHQMMRPTGKAEIIGFAKTSPARERMTELNQHPSTIRQVETEGGDRHEDPEIVYYPDEAFFCFQAHPEFGHAETTKVFFDIMPKAFADN